MSGDRPQTDSGPALRYFLKINSSLSVHFNNMEFSTRYSRTLLLNGKSGDRPQTDSRPCLALVFNSFQFLTLGVEINSTQSVHFNNLEFST